MMNEGAESKKDPKAVLREALSFFGDGGVGLDVEERTDSTVKLAGKGGFVLVSAVPKERGSDVRVVSQEWDEQAKQFMERL